MSVTFAGLVRELGRTAGDRLMPDFQGRTTTFGQFDARTDRVAGCADMGA